MLQISKYVVFTLLFFLGIQTLVLPVAGKFFSAPITYASDGSSNPVNGSSNPVNGSSNPVNGSSNPVNGSSNPSNGVSTSLQNPLGSVTIQQFFLKIIDIILIFAMPIIILFIILAGFKYVTAQGNTEQIKTATTALTWAIIGGVLILGAKAILTIIEGTIQAIR